MLRGTHVAQRYTRSQVRQNSWSHLKGMPHDFNAFTGFIRHPTFAKDMHVIIQKRKEVPRTFWPLATKHYGYTVVSTKSLETIGPETTRVHSGPGKPAIRVHKTPLENFWFCQEHINQEHHPGVKSYDEYRITSSATATAVKPEEHFIKLFLYRQLAKKLEGILQRQHMTGLPQLAGSLGKGLIKPGSDIDMVLIDPNMRRSKHSYTHYHNWWQQIGKENALDKLHKLDRNGKLHSELTTQADLLLIDNYVLIDGAKVPIITFDFGDIPVDIQCDNFIAVDEVAIQRFLIQGANPLLLEANNRLVQWARQEQIVGSGGLDTQLKPFHYTSMLLFFCMQRNYLPITENCICPVTFSDKGNVILSKQLAEKQVKQCVVISDVDELLMEFADFMTGFDCEHSMNLFDGQITKSGRSTPYLYSMKNMVTTSEMTSLYKTGATSYSQANLIKQTWPKLYQECHRKLSRAAREHQQSEANNANYQVKDKSGTAFDFDF